jgi:hypothetical protein
MAALVLIVSVVVIGWVVFSLLALALAHWEVGEKVRLPQFLGCGCENKGVIYTCMYCDRSHCGKHTGHSCDPVKPEGICCSGISEPDLCVIKANRLDLSDDERAQLDEQFRAALVLVDGIPYVPGPDGETNG